MAKIPGDYIKVPDHRDPASKFPKPTSYEPMTASDMKALYAGLGSLQSMILDLHKVDLSAGRGRIDGRSACCWLTTGQRLTVSIIADGGVIAGLSSEPDPDYLARKEAGFPS